MLKYILYVRFKGHSMLAPFTAGWQSTDLHPLVIERSEVMRSYFVQFLVPCYNAVQDFENRYYMFIRHIAVVVSGALHLVAHLQGSYVYDINGKKSIDALAGLWCTALGMCKLWYQI